ncbi:MAG: ribosomal-processing cysteine protease Prp [Erysipelotrichaceae bacterium]|nr:ribosomal-processing cysteine protease Prp [Erysipelotrichaceae bacterium]
MVNVKIVKEENNILEIEVSGHAGSAEYGFDLVCAGVSTACVGIANELDKRDFLDCGSIELETGYCHIVVEQLNEIHQVVLETFETILKSIEESYKDYLKIMEMEV